MQQKINKKTVTLVLTQNCNLNCLYCYEHDKTEKVMPVCLAKEIIKKELSANDGYEEVIIDMFGGEPFLAFDAIKECFDYVWNNQWEKKRMCFLTTNGTLVHGKIQEWLYPRRNYIQCGLSIDGNKELHDINRCNSFDSIDLKFFHDTWPNQSVKMTISQESLPKFSEGIIFLHEYGFIVNANLAHGIDWSSPLNIEILEAELNKLIDYYLEHPNITPCSMMSMMLPRLALNKENINERWCGTGQHMITYDIDGKTYPCQMFLPLSSSIDRVSKLKDIDFNDDEIFKDPQCAECVILPICPNCYGMNYSLNGSVEKREIGMCKLIKIIALAVSKFEYLKLEKYGVEVFGPKDEQYKMLRGIERVQAELII